MTINIGELKTHPLTMVIAKLEATIMGLRENQYDLISIVAKDMKCSKELLFKAMHEATREMEKKID